MATQQVFIYLWGLPTIAPCKHCGVSNKVFRHFINRPHDAFYICQLGHNKTECRGNTNPSPDPVAQMPLAEPERPEDLISKRGDAALNQDEISLLFAKANQK
jgi:hypothetical protein